MLRLPVAPSDAVVDTATDELEVVVTSAGMRRSSVHTASTSVFELVLGPKSMP